MSDKLEITGTVERILDIETFDSGFTKQTLVLNTGGEYPQTIPVEFFKDKTSLLSGLQPGQAVTVAINLRGREHNGKYYANVQGWKLESANAAPAQQPVAAQPTSNQDSDDIPF
jgi:hypothetical protein